MSRTQVAPKRAKPATAQPAADLLIVAVDAQFPDRMEDRRAIGQSIPRRHRPPVSPAATILFRPA
jgi:hypothetical protein